MSADSRGILYPARLPSFRRVPASGPVEELVRWFWIPEWDIAAGRSSRQYVVAYPACNLVVQPGEVTLSGPTTRLVRRPRPPDPRVPRPLGLHPEHLPSTRLTQGGRG